MKLALEYGGPAGGPKPVPERTAAPSRSPWSVGARSETGYVRSENEDRMARVRSGDADLYVVVDGMGGHESGALAAALTADTLCDAFAAAPRKQARETSLRLAFAQANAVVHARARQAARGGSGRGMGATAVALLTVGRHFMVAHVGDSRAYLLRRGQLQRLTRDHSRVQRLLDAGMLSPQEAADHPDASVIERAMGHQATVEVECSTWQPLRRGDRILLCSDGLCGYAGEDEIRRVLQAGGSAQEQADNLVKLALSKGGEDNVTVQLACYGAMAGSEGGTARVLTAAALLLSLVSLGLAGAAGWAVLDQRGRLQELQAARAVADARLDLHNERVAALEAAARQARGSHAGAAPAPAASTTASTSAATPPPAPAARNPQPAPKPHATPRKPPAPQARPKPRPAQPPVAASTAASAASAAAAASKPAATAEPTPPASAP